MTLSNRTRTSLAAIAEVLLPAGTRLPAGGEATVRTLERALVHLPSSLSIGLTALAKVADALALRHGHLSIDAVAAPKRAALLEGWRQQDAYPARMAFKALATALKAAHVGDPAIIARSGCRLPADHLEDEAAPWLSQALDLAQSAAPEEELEAEVVIVGSGAGGCAAARVLATRGVAVVLLEAGGLYRRSDFVGSLIARCAPMYSAWGTQTTLGNVSILVPTGRAVGGTTVVNSGTCLRLPPWVADSWKRELGAPVSLAELDPWFTSVEAWLEVAKAEQPALGEPARIIARGAEALGLAHGPLPRNAPGCDGAGTCCFGCPTGAKKSADLSLLPAALKAGAVLYYHATVDRFAATAEGVEVVATAPNGRRVRVKALVGIAAAGTLRTPKLLADSGVAHPLLGRNLSIHPAAGAMGLYPFDVAMDEAIPQGYALEGLREQGLTFEGASTPFEITALGLDLVGPRLVEVLEAHRRLLTFGFNIRDDSRGRVRSGPGGQPVLTYDLCDRDVAKFGFGLRVLVDLLVRGGAQTVFPPVRWLPEVSAGVASRALDGHSLRASDLNLSAYHPLGTARMGLNAASSVVDMDLRVRGAPSLMVCDGSVLPGSMGANPQITIMALAARAADRLAERLGS